MNANRILTLGASLLLLSACGGPEEELATDQAALEQNVRVKSLSDGHSIRYSWAELERDSWGTYQGVEVEVSTRELNSREQVDVLWAIFNNSSACTNGNPVTGSPCGPPDLFIPETQASLHFVATLTADRYGRLSY